MGEYAGQSIFHALVAALVVEALVRLWKVDQPAQKLLFRGLALAVPLALVPSLALFAPGRGTPAFHEEWALFVGTRWAEIRPAGVGLYWVWLLSMGMLGLGLLLLDLVPLLKDLKGTRRAERAGRQPPSPPPDPAGPERLLAELASRLSMRVPRLVVTGEEAPRLYCGGVLRPRIVVSAGTLLLLDPAELRAALAHELGHLWRADPLLSWALAAARVLLFFNPVFHLVARTVAHEAEFRADDFAASATADRLALASGFLKLSRAASPGGRGTLVGAPLSRARAIGVEARCRRLLLPSLPAAVPFCGLRLALTAGSLGALLYFVV
ncbi:MAG: M56 family metallopeptidase [Myxococcaceae bacterium]